MGDAGARFNAPVTNEKSSHGMWRSTSRAPSREWHTCRHRASQRACEGHGAQAQVQFSMRWRAAVDAAQGRSPGGWAMAHVNKEGDDPHDQNNEVDRQAMDGLERADEGRAQHADEAEDPVARELALVRLGGQALPTAATVLVGPLVAAGIRHATPRGQAAQLRPLVHLEGCRGAVDGRAVGDPHEQKRREARRNCRPTNRANESQLVGCG